MCRLASNNKTDFCRVELQAATYYCVRLGFKEIGYKGLETGSRQIAAHVVQQNKVCILYLSSVDGIMYGDVPGTSWVLAYRADTFDKCSEEKYKPIFIYSHS